MNDPIQILDYALWGILEGDTDGFALFFPEGNRIKAFLEPQEVKPLDRQSNDLPRAKLEWIPQTLAPNGPAPRTFGMRNYTDVPIDYGVPMTATGTLTLTYSPEQNANLGDGAALARRALLKRHPNLGVSWVTSFELTERRRYVPIANKPELAVRAVEATFAMRVNIRPKMSLLTA